MASEGQVLLSVIVPAYNNPEDLEVCLSALVAEVPEGSEILVVDDASAGRIGEVAASKGVATLRLDKNSGPSSARNAGARRARGEVLLFVDSDVVVRPGAVRRMVQVLADDPAVAAVFGSYDNQPRAAGILSQYRNLLHHYVHQTGRREASTFWAGLGAIRRRVFEDVGGFDEGRYSRCMEDIELGYRLRRAQHRIVLEKAAQGTHLKKWTLRSIVKTDVQCRAVPWTRLMLEHNVPNDLNLKAVQRASVALVGVACLFAPFAIWRWPAVLVSGAAILAVVALNLDLYLFFSRERGPLFAVSAVPLHLLYFFYSGLTFVWVWSSFRLGRALGRGARVPSG